MGRWLRNPRATGLLRELHAAQADHRDDPEIPGTVMPQDIVLRWGARADVQRPRNRTRFLKPSKRGRQRAPWKE